MSKDLPNITNVMKEATQLYEDSVRDSAIQEGLFKTGRLANSIQSELKENDTKFQIQVSMEDYGIYQDSGINGVRGSVAADNRSLYPPGQFKSKTIGGNLPFAVRFSIAQNGLKPRPFIVGGQERVTNNYLVPKLNDAGVKDIEQFVQDSVSGDSLIQYT